MRNIGLPDTPLDPEVEALGRTFRHHRTAILDIFRTLHAAHGGLTDKTIADVARVLHISPAQAHGVASFYAMLATPSGPPRTIRLCDSPPCWLRGGTSLRAAVEEACSDAWTVTRTSCLGLCDHAPAALVDSHQCGPLAPEHVSDIWEGCQSEMPAYTQPLPGEVRVLLAHAGAIDPWSLDSALAHGAYESLRRALEQPPEDVIREVEASGVRGRGGAGFPAGQKWRYVALQPRTPKYVVCNADESEPLVFKDRVLMDTNPHQLLEGIALAAYAVGARECFLYIRGEYTAQAEVLGHAIREAEARGYLGERLLGTDFSCRIHLHRGAGAYICGEETALLESLQGNRGEPRLRPPYPTTSGYHGAPTVVNNVETLAMVPAIVAHGAAWYRSLGNPETPGTKLYTVLGHVNRPGLFEAPYGLTLRHIIGHFGGGMRPGSTFYFALTGGAAGTLVPDTLLDVPIDYTSAARGVMLGAGAFLVCDRSVSPVMLLRELMHFFAVESCGKCTPCRVGTLQARQLLDRMLTGAEPPGGVEALAALAEVLEKASFCGLGQSAAWPIHSALQHFRVAFDAAPGTGEEHT